MSAGADRPAIAAVLPPALLGPADPPPVEAVDAGGGVPLLILCDHAGRRIPRALGTLGLAPADLGRHIAWDIGAADVARRLAARFGAPLLLAAYSRLVVDANRYPHDPAAMATVSDGTPIPGNQGLVPAERERREAEVFHPYHARIAAALDRMAGEGVRPLVLSVHTMTDRLGGGTHRPQQLAVCWAGDGRWARSALATLGADAALCVGDNCPYAVDIGVDYTIPEHAIRRGLPWLQIEFRQDLVATAAGAAAWADRFAPAVERILGDAALMAPA